MCKRLGPAGLGALSIHYYNNTGVFLSQLLEFKIWFPPALLARHNAENFSFRHNFCLFIIKTSHSNVNTTQNNGILKKRYAFHETQKDHNVQLVQNTEYEQPVTEIIT